MCIDGMHGCLSGAIILFIVLTRLFDLEDSRDSFDNITSESDGALIPRNYNPNAKRSAARPDVLRADRTGRDMGADTVSPPSERASAMLAG